MSVVGRPVNDPVPAPIGEAANRAQPPNSVAIMAEEAGEQMREGAPQDTDNRTQDEEGQNGESSGELSAGPSNQNNGEAVALTTQPRGS